MIGRIFLLSTLILSLLGLSSCHVERSIIKDLHADSTQTESKVASASGGSKKFGMGNLTVRQHSKLVHRARMSGRNSHSLSENQKFQNESIRVYSKHFFIFRMSRAESEMEVWQVNP